MERVETKEGFDDVPLCQSAEHTNIPACYATLQKEDYLGYISDFTNEDYILKTKIVTPVCPNDPYDPNTSDVTKPEERIVTTNADYDQNTFGGPINQNTSRDVSANMVRNDVSANNINNKNDSHPLLQEKNNPEPSNSPSSSINASINIPSLPSFKTNDYMISEPEKPKEPKPAEPADCKSTPEKAPALPPCPACERCPEPVVDCKRVVHYKDKQYPMPIEETIFTRF